MNSILEQYSSARFPNESLAFCRNSIEQDRKKQEFINKMKVDRGKFSVLTKNEIMIFNDKLQNFNRMSMERRSTDLKNQQLPFDLDNDRIGRRKEQQNIETLATTLKSMRTIFENKSKKSKFTNAQLFIISPDGYGKLAWDFLCMMLIFYEVLSIPFKISFEIEDWEQLQILIDVVFMLDILLNFTTAIYKQGMIHYDYKTIAMNYIKLWFWIDLISSFPYDYVVEAAVVSEESDDPTSTDAAKATLIKSSQILRLLRFLRFIKIIRLLRLAKLKVITDKIEEYFQAYATLLTIVNFLKLSFFVLFWSHWLGCIFHFIAVNEDPDHNWMTIIGIYEEDYIVRYINSIYWAVTTMITVGYGDISPQTPIERFFGIFFLLVACGVYSFTLNTIGNAMQQLNQKRDLYRKRIAEINNYMNKVKIPKQLQNQIRKYLQYMWDSNRTIQLNSICQNLSQILKYELTIQVVGSVLSYYPYFCKLFQRECLIELTQILQEQTLQPDEFVFQENEPKNLCKLYFIQDGNIKIILMRTGQILALKSKKEIFGEINFFGNVQRTASAKSDGFTNVFYVDREEFIVILQKFPNDLQKFNLIYDDIQKKELQALNIHCYSCDLPGHVARDCPSLHFVVDTYIYQKIKSRCLRQIMRQFVRRDIAPFNAWTDSKIIKKEALHIQDTVPLYKFISEDCNIEEDNSMQVSFAPVPNGFILKSKFKDDKVQRRTLQKVMRQQNQQLSSIQKRQSDLINYTQSLSQALLQSPIPTPDVQSQTSVDDSLVIKQKLDDLLLEYKTYRKDLDKQNGNQQEGQTQQYILLSDFDRGIDYEIYNPHNNLSVVIKELKRYNFGVEVKPKIETEFEQNAFNEYVDYYGVDLSEIERFQLEVKPDQLKQCLPYTTLSAYSRTRQMKKLSQIGPSQTKPSQKLKLAINRIKAIKQITQMQ